MATLTVIAPPAGTTDGLRSVNLKTDLSPLADLMETAFADSMDSGGRAAIREMRALSRFGTGLNILSNMNDLVMGIGLGYVWIQDGRLVGNVSIYPASNLPPSSRRTWIIANVAVHPDYRGRGISRRLMETSLDNVRERGGDVLLQVDESNMVARRLYQTLSFESLATFTTWRRPAGTKKPRAADQQTVYITRRGQGEWRVEYALAQRVRPNALGGIGWLRPLHQQYFHRSLRAVLSDVFNLRSHERLIIRSDDGKAIHAAMWIERAFGSTTNQLTLMVDPPYQGVYDDALLLSAARRFDGETLTIEHPSYDDLTAALLRKYQFEPVRTLVHMHWKE